MEGKQGFYSVEPLNNEFTRIALVWNNTMPEGYGNITMSKEIVAVKDLPRYLAGTIGRLE